MKSNDRKDNPDGGVNGGHSWKVGHGPGVDG